MNRRWPEVLGRQLRGQLCDFLWARRLRGKIPAERYGRVNLTETPQEEREALGRRVERLAGTTELGWQREAVTAEQPRQTPASKRLWVSHALPLVPPFPVTEEREAQPSRPHQTDTQ